MSLRILLLACRRTGYETVHQILNSSHHLVGVVSTDFPRQVDDGVKAKDILSLASRGGAETWNTSHIHESSIVTRFRKLNPDVGISMGWRRLVREPLVNLPRLGFVNFHTSDLPRYRGFASTSWAILLGDSTTAITAHRMVDGKADEGDILKKEYLPIKETTTIATLFDEIFKVIPGMCVELLDELEDGTVKALSQDEDKAILSFPRRPWDAWIDWRNSAVAIDRLVRAVTRPYPGALTCLDTKLVTIWKGHVLKEPPRFVGMPGHVVNHLDDGSVWVLTGDSIYVVEEAEIEGEPPVSPAKLFPGMQKRLGMTEGVFFSKLRELKDLKS